MRILKGLLIMMIVAAMLWVWPVHPFREVDSVRSGDEGHTLTKPIGIGESVTQYFAARDNNIIQIEFVMSCDDAQLRTGEFLFELLDGDGEAIFMQNLDYAGIFDYRYGGSVVNVRVKKGRQYAYRLTNLSVSENPPCGVYTTDHTMYCLDQGTLEIAGQAVEGELLTRITTYRPLTAKNTVAIWGCICMVGFMLYEVLVRIERRRDKES